VGAADSIEVTDAEGTRRLAAGSSFYAAMRILPRAQRQGMFEIYSFCRQVDDIADSDGPRAQRLAALARWRQDIEAMYAGRPPAGLAALAAVTTAFQLQKADFMAVIDGMEMDVVDTIVAPDAATLDLYCDRVASAVGRLSVRTFGMAEDEGVRLSHDLGRALQLTNILRDIDEDAAIGRVYLPREALAAAGIVAPTPERVAQADLDAACAPLVAQARAYYDGARRLMATQPRRVVIAPRVMAQAYGAILDKLQARGFAPPRRRPRVSRLRLVGALLAAKLS
jgi:squalene synthase HpnD